MKFRKWWIKFPKIMCSDPGGFLILFALKVLSFWNFAKKDRLEVVSVFISFKILHRVLGMCGHG